MNWLFPPLTIMAIAMIFAIFDKPWQMLGLMIAAAFIGSSVHYLTH